MYLSLDPTAQDLKANSWHLADHALLDRKGQALALPAGLAGPAALPAGLFGTDVPKMLKTRTKAFVKN